MVLDNRIPATESSLQEQFIIEKYDAKLGKPQAVINRTLKDERNQHGKGGKRGQKRKLTPSPKRKW